MMVSQSTILFFLGIPVLFVSGGLGKTHDWDYITFSQGWPQTRCIEESVSQQHTCVIPRNVGTWIIHGIWPSYNGQHRGPEYCNKSDHFNPNKIQRLEKSMRIYWPNLFTDTEYDSFWEHEWDAHGTCAVSVPAMGNEYKFFKKGLELGLRFPLLKYLGHVGITPDDDEPYELNTIRNAMEKMLNVSINVECFEDEDKAYLAELHICLTKDFQLIDCPDSYSSTFGYCKKTVYYPVIDHSLAKMYPLKFKPFYRLP